MDRNLTPRDDCRTTEEIVESRVPNSVMNDEEIRSAMFRIQYELPVLLAMPLRHLLTTFESVEHIVAVKAESKDWAESLRGFKRNHEVTLVLKRAQDELKEILARYK
jgi:hypothetical protein